ncbi:MAG: NB-ARC domain-containing protein, partial [Leptolyngbya sp. SIO1D8]|nr:NB-ARC domain-containing protein [Leptolyngbya sp. SIO1D8]
MGAEAVLELADSLVFTATGKHLNDLQRMILKDVWQRQTYREIARRLRYTEGHIKDVASQLWQTLSQVLDERVTKSNSLTVLERYLQKNHDKRSLQLEVSSPTQPAEIPRLLGREAAIAQLNRLIDQGQRAIVIQGEGGIGKTTLAQQYLEHPAFELSLELLMAKETANITPAEQVVEEWLRQDFQVEPGQDFGVTLERLKRQLRTQRVGILIDNLEPALDAQGRFWAEHSRYGDLLRILCDPKGKTVTLLTSRDRLCEPGVTVTHYRLPGLSLDTWKQFWEQHRITCSAENLMAMHRAYGGNAKAMNILGGAISGDFEGDGDAYWQENRADPLMALDLKNLVNSQVVRLQALDEDAYRLFYRLGCYRYQDVPRIPTEGLRALMWDVDPARHHQV